MVKLIKKDSTVSELYEEKTGKNDLLLTAAPKLLPQAQKLLLLNP